MTPREFVTRVQLCVVKSRSNAAESEGLAVAIELQPRLWGDGPMSVLDVTSRMLVPGREVAVIDAINAAALLRSQEGGDLLFFLRWQTDLPTPFELVRDLDGVLT